eukprot:CAMPEP_0181185108 /NCGR_PEP_ID=MMETSP1096-20121128/9328_1 /TAXON_ID=156174 ORGANISM="Chrysochromulina ericina, Strain CCMP281" /NCGR_SAMPLE_ID=MMETSP1096 /ASSEMBLY_ACC=CAM_ASM_000453 /LENGTH=706 /DNA_ID=CAMNT_0023273923 /DNA_START=129 /DNA_END=2251 /DNA_ORIENTATION=-
MKALLPGSVLVLKNGKVAKIPVDRALISTNSTPPTLSLSVVEEVGGTAHPRNEAWCNANIDMIYSGILTDGTKTGPMWGSLSMSGIPITVTLVADPDASAPTIFSHVMLAAGAGLEPKAVAIADMAPRGFLPRPWAGGDRPPLLHQGGGLTALADLRATTVVVDHLVGTSGVTIMRKAVLQLLALVSSTSVVTIPLPTLATFLAGSVGLEDRHLALQVALAATAASIGSAPTPTASRVAKCRAAIVDSLRSLFDSIGPLVLATLQARLQSMTAGGFSLSPGGSGSVVRYLRDELFAQERARVLALAAATPVPAPATTPPLTPAPPLPFSPSAAALPEAASLVAPPAVLQGMAVLRPPPILPATTPLTDLAVFVGLGGEPVVKRLATLNGFTEPLIFMSGPGSVASAGEAADNFTMLLDAARASAPTDARLFPSLAPVDLDASAGTLRVVLRTVELSRRTGTAPGGAPLPGAHAPGPASGTTQKRDSTLSKELKSVPTSAGPERIMRACSAALVNPICTEEANRRAALHKALGDPVAEARRNIDLHGARAAGFILSSGEVNGDAVGEAPSALVAARSGLLAHIAQCGERVATPSRAREAAPTILLFSQSTLACDLKSTAIITLCGGLPPVISVWRTDRDLQPAVLGRWGTITGTLALGDAERAMRVIARVLIEIFCAVGGAPAPAEPTLGLVPLIRIQATAPTLMES